MRKWEMVQLGEVCEGKSSNIAQKDLEDKVGKYPIYGASGLIKYVNFFKQEQEYIAVVKDGAGIGRTLILPQKSSIIGTMQYLIPKENIKIKYFFYAVTAMNLSKYHTGATIPHIYFKDYKNEYLYLPPLEIQTQIAKNLDLASDLVKLYQTKLEELDSLIQSVFYDMFGDPVINDKGWEVEKLGDICKIYRGASPRPIEQYLCGVIPWIKIGDATNGDNIFISHTKEKVTENGAKKVD